MMGWDAVGWHGMGWDGMGWDGMEMEDGDGAHGLDGDEKRLGMPWGDRPLHRSRAACMYALHIVAPCSFACIHARTLGRYAALRPGFGIEWPAHATVVHHSGLVCSH